MIFNAIGGGGAAEKLAFQVVGSASQPSSPAANTVWVKTSAAITSWAMQPTAPSSPASGMVWIKTALTGGASLNALTKNALTVAIVGCQQYVSGAWQNKDAYLYGGSAWVQFGTEQVILFQAGGGDASKWTNSGWTYGQFTVTAGTVADDKLTVSAPYGSYCLLGTVDKVDVTNAAKISANITYAASSGGIIQMRLCASKDTNAAAGTVNISASGTVQLDVSSLSGEYYVTFMGAGSNAAGSGATATITKVWCK